MVRTSLSILVVFFSLSLNAETKQVDFQFASFEEAKQAESYLRFDMESTLIGFLTARFPGFAKRFSLNWVPGEGKVTQLKIVIPVDQMDTNRGGRTQEMKEDCLQAPQYPEIIVEMDELKLQPGTVRLTAKGLIRGKTVEIPTELTLAGDKGAGWVVSGQAPVRLGEINIINPTIAKGVASFDDRVKISYRFVIR